METSASGIASVQAADGDGGGDTDIVGAFSWVNEIDWWENAGGSWLKHTIDDAFDGARAVQVTDKNGDGDIDVLGAAFDSNDITWYVNQQGNWSNQVVET